MSSNTKARRGPSGLVTRPLHPVKESEDVDHAGEDPQEDDDERAPEGSSPVRFVLLFFGVPILLLLLGGIIMTPCN
jgi:hypothetical protein